MPLIQGKSDKAFKSNIKSEMSSGRPQKQALAIAYAVKRKAQHKAKGGMIIPEEDMGREHDKVGHLQPEHNEELEPGHGSAPKTSSLAEEHLNMKAQEYEDLDEPEEPVEFVRVPKVQNMAHGGMIAKIMAKRKMAMGGEYPQEPDESYAEGGEVGENEGEHPEYLGDETYPDPDDTEHEIFPEPHSKKRKRLLEDIMQDIRMMHMGLKV